MTNIDTYARAVQSCSPKIQAGMLDTAKKLSTKIDQHFEKNSTTLKAAMYHLNKNEPREVAHILKKGREVE